MSCVHSINLHTLCTPTLTSHTSPEPELPQTLCRVTGATCNGVRGAGINYQHCFMAQSDIHLFPSHSSTSPSSLISLNS